MHPLTPDSHIQRQAGRQLLGGTFIISIGLGVSGVCTVAIIGVAARTLSPHQYAAFAVWWTVATLLAAVFGVFEAYLTRLVVTTQARSEIAAGVTGIIAGRALLTWGLMSVALVAASQALSSVLFEGNALAPLMLPVFLVLAASQSIQRGYANGHRNYVAVAGQLTCDGLLRLGMVVALVALDRASFTSLALACCAGAAGGLVVGARLSPGWLVRPRLTGWKVPITPLLYLLVGSIGPLLVNNGSVPWLAGVPSVDALTLGAFAAAVTLSRIPTQFVAAVFSPLLAQLGHAAETGDRKTFEHLRRRADLGALVIGAVFVVGFALLGAWILSVYVGPQYQLSVPYLAVLAAASSVMFVAVVQQACLAAVGRWPRIAVAWLCAAVAFVIVLLLPVAPLWRATAAPLVAVLTAVAVLTVLSRRTWELRSPQPTDGGEAGPPTV